MRSRIFLLLCLAGAAPRAGAQPPAADASAASRTGVLEGVVRDSAGTLLRGASVIVATPARAAITDSGGRFRLDSLPSDTIEVAVRRVGYAPAYFALAIPPDTRVSIAVKMLPNVQSLGAVIVDGQRRDLGLNRAGYYERARRTGGTFFGPDFMAPRQQVSRLSTVLREAPSLMVACRRGGCTPFLRNGISSCVPLLWVDGVAYRQASDYDEIVRPNDVKAVEIYRSAGETPPQFRMPMNACGSVVVWTKWMD